ncbi:PorT family protein [Chitinophaga sp. Mgbs1]|uniref:PorT family protein n=1 Tax=Chitinophaga solisilvae TaxID=1233460 RepID=A0A433WMW2_9BACT|nr:PorT family protein [Chitinophaga solisilvae]
MKKILLALLLAIAAVTGTFAQKSVQFGVKAGANVSTFKEYGAKMRPGFYAGGYADFRINKSLHLQPELLYSTYGQTRSIPYAFYNNTKVQSHFVHLPVMIKYYPVARLYLEAGPQFGYNFTTTVKDEPTGKRNIAPADKFHLGVNVGVGYYLGNGFSATLRHTWGIVPSRGFYTGGSMNNVVQAGISYSFSSPK